MLKGCSEIGHDNRSASLGRFPTGVGTSYVSQGIFFFLKKNHIIKVIYVSYKKQPQDKMKLPSLHSHFQFALKQFALHCPQIF